MKKRPSLITEFLSPMVLFIAGFSYYLYLQSMYPLLYGVDGAFYAGEIKCILVTGYPCLADSPLPLYISALFALTGMGIEYSVKFSLALFTAITVIPIYLLARRIGGVVNAVTASIIYLVNPFTMRLGVEFLKNIVALFFLAVFFYYFHNVFIEKQYGKYKYIYLYMTVLLIAFSHILVYGVLILFTIIVLAYSIILEENQVAKIIQILLFELLLAVAGMTTPILGWSPYFRAVSEGGSQLAIFRTIDYMNPNTLLSLSAISLLIYIVYRMKDRRIIALPLLIIGSITFVPLPLLAGLSWRLLLLFSIYLPISIALFFHKPNTQYIYLVIGLGLTVSSIILSVNGVPDYYRPLISRDIVEELEIVVHGYMGKQVIFIVPDKVLRHWVFFLVAPHKVFDDYDRVLLYLEKHRLKIDDYIIRVIMYSPDPAIEPPPPSIPHILLYHGRYIYVYEVKV